ncbi:transketolase [Ignavibacteria bacterium]|nr:transketolase [Bacteroidota bacterium]MCZ2131944.1 transketolase [Bacteroidota bacterium]
MNFDFTTTTFDNRRHSADELAVIAKEIRQDIIKMLAIAKSGHSGGPLSSADIFAVLYFNGCMNYDSQNPAMPGRDRFILSAGHMCPVQYAALANAGFFPKEELATLRQYNTRLQGHPARDMGLPGIETSSGSLGQGISVAVGMAMSDKLLDKNNACVFALTGDGELQEGSVWEAAMAASNFGLDNFCWIIDNNDCQIDGRLRDVMNVYPIVDKCVSFGFDVVECNGHNFDELAAAFDAFKKNHAGNSGKPTAIIANTKMGRGVSFMEDSYKWHGMPPNSEQAVQALKDLA